MPQAPQGRAKISSAFGHVAPTMGGGGPASTEASFPGFGLPESALPVPASIGDGPGPLLGGGSTAPLPAGAAPVAGGGASERSGVESPEALQATTTPLTERMKAKTGRLRCDMSAAVGNRRARYAAAGLLRS